MSDPIATVLRGIVKDSDYGYLIDHVVVYGSRARGDHRAGSDVDFAVFLFDDVRYYPTLSDEGLPFGMAGRLGEIAERFGDGMKFQFALYYVDDLVEALRRFFYEEPIVDPRSRKPEDCLINIVQHGVVVYSKMLNEELEDRLAAA